MSVNLIVLIPLLGPLAAPPGGLDLRPRFTAGQVIRYHSGSTIEHRTALVDAPGMPLDPVVLQTEAMMTLRIVDTDPEAGTRISWTLERLGMRSTLPNLHVASSCHSKLLSPHPQKLY